MVGWFYICALLVVVIVPLANTESISRHGTLLLTEGRSGSTFVGEILNQDKRVMYFYEPCRSLGDRSEGTYSKQNCEDLVIRLLCCNATESDIWRLLGDWRAVKRDASLLKIAAHAGALTYDESKLNVPGKLNKALEPGKLGAAFSSKCTASWRVVKELSNRFEAPIPRRIVRSIKQSAAAVLDETIAAASGWVETETAKSAGLTTLEIAQKARNELVNEQEHAVLAHGSMHSEEQGDVEGELCIRYPNHWACRGAVRSHTAPPPSFKVLHLVRDVRGVLLSRLSLEAFCGDQTPLACATPLCNSMRRTVASASHMISDSEIHLKKAHHMLNEAEAQLKEAADKLAMLNMDKVFEGSSGIHSQFFSFDSPEEGGKKASTTTASASEGSRARLENEKNEAKLRVQAIQHVISKHEISSYYTIIRYEDFALEPLHRAGILYQWLGLIGPEGALPREVAQWLKQATNGNKADGDFGVTRINSKKVAAKWISELPRVAIEAATLECADVLNELKYPVKSYLPPSASATSEGIDVEAVLGPIRSKAKKAKLTEKSTSDWKPRDSRVESLGIYPLIDWTAVDEELTRIEKVHPQHVRQRALTSIGVESMIAFREALGRIVSTASDLAAWTLEKPNLRPSSPPPSPRLNIGVLGGSFTAGTGTNVDQWKYPVLVSTGLQRVMPHVAVNVVRDASYVNTGSLSTALCLDTLIGSKHAEIHQNSNSVESEHENEEIDLLLTEFATEDRALYRNDGFAYELLVRGILSIRPKRPVMINVMSYGRHLSWRTAQESMTTINDHYGVTGISIRDAILPIINPDNSKKKLGDSTLSDIRKKFPYPTVSDLCGSNNNAQRRARRRLTSVDLFHVKNSSKRVSVPFLEMENMDMENSELEDSKTRRQLSKMARSSYSSNKGSDKQWQKNKDNAASTSVGASAGGWQSSKWQKKKEIPTVTNEPQEAVVWGPGDDAEKRLAQQWCLPDKSIHKATADMILHYLLSEMKSWKLLGQTSCRNPSADPNNALLTGGCRYYGKMVHHTSNGGAVDDHKLSKFLKMLELGVDKQTVMKRAAFEGVDVKELSKAYNTMSQKGGAQLSPSKLHGGSDTPYQPPVSLSLRSRKSKLKASKQVTPSSAITTDEQEKEDDKTDDDVSNTEYQVLSRQKMDEERSVHSSFSHLGRASMLMIDFFPALTSSNSMAQSTSNSLSSNQLGVNLVNHRGLTLRRPMCMMNQNEGQNMHNDMYQQHHHTQSIAHNPSLQLLNPSLLAELQWLGNSLSYNELVQQRSSKAGLLTTSDSMAHESSSKHYEGSHQQHDNKRDDFETGWELIPIRDHSKGRDMKFKLGLLNLKTNYYPQYMVSKSLAAEALIQVDVVQGLIYITSCPHQWNDNTDQEEEDYKKTSPSHQLAALLASDSSNIKEGEETEEFKAFKSKLAKLQRRDEHHFSALLLQHPSSSSLSKGNSNSHRSPQDKHHFKRVPVFVRGEKVDTLIPVLSVTNEVWQLTPEPPPGRYILQITPNKAIDNHSGHGIQSKSCFHGVITA